VQQLESWCEQPAATEIVSEESPTMSSATSTPRPTQEHLRAEPANTEGRIIDSSPSCMFVDGLRKASVTITDKAVVRFGDPTGKSLDF
jgi:hypothetical protein